MAHFSDEGLCPVGLERSPIWGSHISLYSSIFSSIFSPQVKTVYWNRLCVRSVGRKFNLKTNHRGCRHTWMSRQPNMPRTKDFKRHPDILLIKAQKRNCEGLEITKKDGSLNSIGYGSIDTERGTLSCIATNKITVFTYFGITI